MTDSKRALVLHLAGGGDPLLVAVSSADADALSERLPALVRAGDFETVTAANGTTVTINFAHVAVAQVDVVAGLGGQLFGAPAKVGGFSA
jgi:hypothetical protein